MATEESSGPYISEDGATMGRDFVIPGVDPTEPDPYRFHTGRKRDHGGEDAIEVIDLVKQFGRARILNGLNLGLPEDRVTLQEVPAMAISSTDCRDRVRRGMPVWYLVPDGVVQYIEKRGLYRDGQPPTPPGQLLPGTEVRHAGAPLAAVHATVPRSAAPAATHASPPGPTDGPGTPELQEMPR